MDRRTRKRREARARRQFFDFGKKGMEKMQKGIQIVVQDNGQLQMQITGMAPVEANLFLDLAKAQIVANALAPAQRVQAAGSARSAFQR